MIRAMWITWWFGLVLWMTALGTAATSAMNVFPAMRELNPTLPDYALAPIAEHGRYGAGEIMDGVFFTVDLMQFSAVLLCAISTALLVIPRVRRTIAMRRPANRIRLGAVGFAAACFLFYAGTIAPGMNRTLRLQWDAAKAGDMEKATQLRDAFDADHQRSDFIFKLSLIGILVAIPASACMGVAHPGATHADD